MIALVSSLLSFVPTPAQATPLPTTVNCDGGGTFSISGTEVTGTSTDSDNSSTCAGDVVIPDGVTLIGYTAFSGSPATSIVLPDSVNEIGVGAFQFMTNLTEIDLGNGVEIIGDYAFWGNTAVTTITIPDSVVSIGQQAFKENISLTSLTLNDGLETIGIGAFQDCRSLSTLQIPNSVTSIGHSPFVGVSSLVSVNIPNGVTSIDSSFTSGVNSLETIHIGNGLTSMTESMFYTLSKLREITVSVDNGAFSADSNGVLFNKNKSRLIQYPQAKTSTTYVIPSSVDVVRQSAFDNAANLVSIEIPASVTSLGDYPFSGALSLQALNVSESNLNFNSDSGSGVLLDKLKQTLILYPPARPNTTYEIPSTVTTLLDEAFVNLTRLRTLRIPASVTSIGTTPFVFQSASSLRAFIVDEGNSNFASIDGVLTDDSVQQLLRYPISKLGSTYTFPASIVGIQSYAFASVKNLTSLVIPSTVSTIAEASFSGMPALTSATIGDGVLRIESNTFQNSFALATVSIGNSVTTIDQLAFQGLTSLTSISIGNSVQTIGYQAFADTSLNNLIIPDNVQIIGGYAFQNISTLTSVSIGNGVTSIGNGAFRYNQLLRTVTFSSCDSVIQNLNLSNIFSNSPNVEYVYSGSVNPCTLSGGVTPNSEATTSGILSIPTITFPSTPYGSSSTKTVTIRNSGTAALNAINPPVLDSNYLQDFTFVTTCGSQSLAVNATCQITVTFTPIEENVIEYQETGFLDWQGYPGGGPIKQRLIGNVPSANSNATYSVFSFAGDNGSISQIGAGSITEGSNATITITPDAGYEIATVTVDSTNISLSSLTTVTGQTKSYTFSSVVADHTVEVTFRTITLNRPTISGPSRITGTVGNAITPVNLTLGGGTGPETATVTASYALPTGLTLTSAGRISGTPTVARTSITSFTVTDSLNETATALVEFVISVAAPTYVPPTPVAFVRALTAPQIHLTDGKLICTPGTYNAGFTLEGVIVGSATTLFSPTSFTYSLLINGIKQASFQITTANKSASWDPPASASGTLFTCSVMVTSNSATTTDSSSDNSNSAAAARSAQSQAITTANTNYTNALAQNTKNYEKALVDNRSNWRAEIEKIKATYYAERDRLRALPVSKENSALRSIALKTYMTAQKKSASDYKDSKPAAAATKDAANKAALDAKTAAIAKANNAYGAFIESIGYGVIIP